MSLNFAAIPLAFFAGIVGVVSPCVWPLVPVVTSSAAISGKTGPLYLAAGLSVSFAVAGTLLTWLLVSTSMDPEYFRLMAAVMLLLVGLILIVPSLSDWVTMRLSMLSGRLRLGSRAGGNTSARGQFGVGALLGIVWLPCVGPTLGAAIALASMGQDMLLSFIVMLAYGTGTAGVLLLAGFVSTKLLTRWRPQVMAGSGLGKKLLGGTLLLLSILVLTGMDKWLEAMAIVMLPEWIFEL